MRHGHRGVTRRRFGVLVGGGLATMALPACARAGRRDGAASLPPLAPASGSAVPVCVTGVRQDAAPEATAHAVRTAALAVDGLAWLSRGDTVLLKVACNSGNAYPATTDPVAIRAMVELLRERGAGRVVVADMSGVQFVRFSKDALRGSTRALMERNGIARAVRDAGAVLHAFEEAGWDAFYEERPAATGAWAGPLMMPAILREVDHVVLMPRCSRHLLAGSTLGLKTAVGWWRHDARLEYHRDATTFAEKTADANTVPTLREKQRLVLTSATRLLTTFGPDQGHVHVPPIGLVLASASIVAHDMVSLAWLLEGRQATPPAVREGPLDDPNGSPLLVNLANRVVVGLLGGPRAALGAERLVPHELVTPWDDRVLRRAFAIAGGVPQVELAAVAASVPPALRMRLADRVTLPPV